MWPLVALSLQALALSAPRAALERRAVLSAAAAAAAAAASPLSPLGPLAPRAALAAGVRGSDTVRGANEGMPRSEKDINAFLRAQGYSPLPSASGCSPLIEYIGTAPPANIDGSKVRERAFKTPLLVSFLYPSGWLVETPTLTENGEAGKIAANDYLKGDAADFVSLPLPSGKGLGDVNKEYLKGWLSSQMTGDVFEDVKVRKTSVVKAADGVETLSIDFTYTLLTRAGFTVERRGVASAMAVTDTLSGLVLTTTAQRFKTLESTFRSCADSFRVYTVAKPSAQFS